ncbi:hypothetical protein [Nesterenkonia populi]
MIFNSTFSDWWLSDEYQLPYPLWLEGERPQVTEDTASDGRTVTVVRALGPGGEPAEYRFEEPERYEYECWRDGEQMVCVDPWTHRRSTRAAWSLWSDWIARQDAAQRLSEDDEWTGDDVGSMLLRAEHNVVSFGDEHTNSANHPSVGDMQGWLDEHTQDMPAQFTVHAAWPETLETHPMLCTGKSPEHEEPNTRVLGVISEPPAETAARRCAMEEHGLSCKAFASMMYEGPTVEAFHSDWGVDAAGLELDASPELRPRMFFIQPQQLDVGLMVPAEGAILAFHHDNDGARADLRVACEAKQAEQNRLEDLYERKWGAWLDESITIPPRGLRTGERSIYQAIEEARTKETAR